MHINLTEANGIAKRIVERNESRAAVLKADASAKHASVVSKRTEEMRRFPAARFHVVETATGKNVGDGSPLPIGFATEICNQRDLFRTGAFVIEAANEQGAALLAWRTAA
jgi:hypothetical protein